MRVLWEPKGWCEAGHHAGSCPGLGERGAHPRERSREVSPRPALQLLARIERTERRVQLVKKDSEREKHRIFQGFEVDEKPEAEACEKLPLEWAPVWGKVPRTQLSSSSSRRKPTFGSAERKTPVKKLVSEFSKVKSKTPKHSPGKEESGGSLSETVCKRELRSQETPEKPRSLLETPLRASAPPKGPGAHPKEKGFFSSETDDLPYLSTTEMYLCRWHQPPPLPLPLREPSPKKEETVASKRWRARRGAGSSVPGNLDDSIFSKRHAKLELDEKRRKRWEQRGRWGPGIPGRADGLRPLPQGRAPGCLRGAGDGTWPPRVQPAAGMGT
ncbi:PREDICTED: male-specific lethal 1 homolog [Pygoscelis adeliae]|uniref:male-specific lethal 1 homolog n=1 Tax=Pygoscelis adeliae TaxID=9238 RepID=UPI0004F4D8AF|nr:PREDICTED: male-specific lethal 1 homolog [Pygoscelis adeliae]